MKKCLLVFGIAIASFFTITTLNAQEYKTAIGARLGSPLSASFKTFITDDSAVELFLNFRGNNIGFGNSWRRFGVGGAWQKHSDLEIDGLEGLQWYAGGGVTAYYWSWSDDFFFDDYNRLTFGLQAYIGLDYAFDDVPVNISIDWVPTYLFGGYVSGFGADYGALSVRYILSE